MQPRSEPAVLPQREGAGEQVLHWVQLESEHAEQAARQLHPEAGGVGPARPAAPASAQSADTIIQHTFSLRSA